MESWFQILSLMLANFGVIWWFRKESREDWRIIHEEMKEFKETSRIETNQFREAVRLEMKDFHERLIEIESARKN